jgi:hypothetical protein
MAAAHSAVKCSSYILVARPRHTAATRARTRSFLSGLLAQAAQAYRLLTSSLQLDGELEGATPTRRRELAKRWLETISR